MNSPVISVVIPAFNRRDSLQKLLDTVFKQQGVDFEVIVVDDCSPDTTADAVRQHFPSATVLSNASNGGPAVSRNRGILAARGEFVVGFDSDVTVPDSTLLKRVLATFQQNPDVTGLAFRIMGHDGLSDDVPRWWHPVPVTEYGNRQFMTHYFSGTGYAFRRQEMMDAGMFPEILYMHYEEVELAFRILDRGGSIMHCPDLQVSHHVHAVSTRSKINVFYKPRNQILVALACYPWLRAITYLFPRLGYHFIQSLRGNYPVEFLRALASAVSLMPRRLSTRAPLRNETWQRIAAMRNPIRG
ncbi:MAG TPA: glycosyltransferase [Verrucomicrobiae bacterium]|nr:glycosyltransferase [Verrucomicrobiae bacterium]